MTADPLDLNAHITTVTVEDDRSEEAVTAQAVAEAKAKELAGALAEDEVVQWGFDKLKFSKPALSLVAHGLLALDGALASLSAIYMDRFPQLVGYLEQWGDEESTDEDHFAATLGKAIIGARLCGEIRL